MRLALLVAIAMLAFAGVASASRPPVLTGNPGAAHSSTVPSVSSKGPIVKTADNGGWCYWNENPYQWSWSPGYQVHFVYSYSYYDPSWGPWVRVFWIADPGYTNIRPLYGACPWP